MSLFLKRTELIVSSLITHVYKKLKCFFPNKPGQVHSTMLDYCLIICVNKNIQLKPFIETISSCLFLEWSSSCNSLCVWNVHPVKQTSHHLNRVAPRRLQLKWTSTFTWKHLGSLSKTATTPRMSPTKK